MVKFQMVSSSSPNTIAKVTNDVDIESFRRDSNWYEITEEEVVKKPVKTVKQPKPNKDEE